MPVSGRLEVTIKISELPEVKTVENNWKHFEVDCGGRIVSITVKPKIWKKLEEAQANFPMWVGAIAGQIGAETETGFVLDNPNIQVFERKPREPKAEPATAS